MQISLILFMGFRRLIFESISFHRLAAKQKTVTRYEADCPPVHPLTSKASEVIPTQKAIGKGGFLAYCGEAVQYSGQVKLA
ncbi:hypothetical protein AYI74_18350 [Shewanella algae]|nr:hypothetical protein AYI74_18350 [Shewanella algae]